MMMANFIGLFCCMTALGVISAKIDGWDSAPNTQYHIQTDEGPERYFKYQTISGQYRKEKRLQDGTVVGSYGWVDADGFLRLNDYIADNAGYRITRSKRLYVGSDTAVDRAVTEAKKVPAQAGTEVASFGQSYRSPGYDAAQNPSILSRPYDVSGGQSPNSLPAVLPTASPLPSTPHQPYYVDRSKVLLFPTSSPAPFSSANQYFRRRPTPPPGYYPSSSSTAAPPLEQYKNNQNEVAITPNVYYIAATSTPRPSDYDFGAVRRYRPAAPLLTVVPKSPQSLAAVDDETDSANENSVYYRNGNKFASSPNVADRRVFSASTADLTPIRSNEAALNGRQPEYDGISVTRNGFQYYLPRQYHEEESAGDTRTGSFGYIDPFGIRRVIYYNSSPNSGFVHRKNNRYVGFNATPYDPRP